MPIRSLNAMLCLLYMETEINKIEIQFLINKSFIAWQVFLSFSLRYKSMYLSFFKHASY